MIKIPLKKNKSNSFFVGIPKEIIKLLKCKEDKFIYCDFARFQPALQRIFETHQEKESPIAVVYGDSKQPKICIGIPKVADNMHVEIFSEKENMTNSIPYSLIIDVDNPKS